MNASVIIAADDPATALIQLAKVYKWDGDLLRCRACNRAQHVLWFAAEFPHPSECPLINAPKNPWLVIRAALATATASGT